MRTRDGSGTHFFAVLGDGDLVIPQFESVPSCCAPRPKGCRESGMKRFSSLRLIEKVLVLQIIFDLGLAIILPNAFCAYVGLTLVVVFIAGRRNRVKRA